jgi:hypothetical protein
MAKKLVPSIHIKALNGDGVCMITFISIIYD